MDWHLLAPFITATLLLLIIPGPVMAIVAHNTLRRGAAAGVATVIGVQLGKLSTLSATFAGLTIGRIFIIIVPVLSLAGAVYLVWLALRAFHRHAASSPGPIATCSGRPIIDGLAIAFSNPTTLIFYTAFFPQFIKPDYSVAQQAFTLGAIYLSTSLIFELILVFAFARLRQFRSYGQPRFESFAALGSAAVYFSIAAVAVFGLTNFPG